MNQFRKNISRKKKLETLSKFDSSIDPWINDTANTLTIFTELETFCSSYLQEAENGADPARIDFINSHLAKIQRLKKSIPALLISSSNVRNPLRKTCSPGESGIRQKRAPEKVSAFCRNV